MSAPATALVSTGIEGLDAILRGGLPRSRLHLIQGAIGAGKTTLGLQFVMAGLRVGESCAYVTLEESEAETREIIESHGWSSEGLPILYQGPVGDEDGQVQTVLHPAEVELPATIDALLDEVERLRPRRLVLDSLSELRTLAREPRWLRRELMRLRDRLGMLDCTALLLDTETTSQDAQSLLGGVIRLERHTPGYGPDRRFIEIMKMRGHAYETGRHDLRIRRGGVAAYPRLVAAEHRRRFTPETLSTGVPRLDEMLGGGLDRGAAVLLLGPTGTAKSTLALQCVAAAAARGEQALVYIFDERIQTVFQRAEGIGIDLERHVDAGRIGIRQVDPAEFTPGEFSDELRRRTAAEQVRLIVIDSLNAYLYSMPDERLLNLHLHELLAFLSQQGVTSLLTATQHGVGFWPGRSSQLDLSYLADTVLLLQIVEQAGRPRKALAVYKRRAGRHDETMRELRFEPGGICLGETLPLHNLSHEIARLEASAGGPKRDP